MRTLTGPLVFYTALCMHVEYFEVHAPEYEAGLNGLCSHCRRLCDILFSPDK